jgi:7-keto-8-aminopelargonate synthetase-like enzyme
MKVYFNTALDKYQNAFISLDLDIIPRIGEKVEILDSLISHFKNQKLPISLEVVNVTYHIQTNVIYDQYVTIELWYNKTDLEIMKASNVNPF